MLDTMPSAPVNSIVRRLVEIKFLLCQLAGRSDHFGEAINGNKTTASVGISGRGRVLVLLSRCHQSPGQKGYSERQNARCAGRYSGAGQEDRRAGC